MPYRIRAESKVSSQTPNSIALGFMSWSLSSSIELFTSRLKKKKKASANLKAFYESFRQLILQEMGFFWGRSQTFLATQVQYSQFLTVEILALLIIEILKVIWYCCQSLNQYKSELIWLEEPEGPFAYHETACIWFHLFPHLVFSSSCLHSWPQKQFFILF